MSSLSKIKRMQKGTQVSPIVGVFLGVMAVSTAAPMIRFAQQQAPSLTIAAFRLGIATLILAPWVLSRNRVEIHGIQQKQRYMLILSGLLLALHFSSWIQSLSMTTVTSSVVMVSTSPLWVALLSPLFLREKIVLAAWFGLMLALVGGIVVALNQSCVLAGSRFACEPFVEMASGREFGGMLLALFGAFCAAGYLMIGRRYRSNLSLPSYTFIVYGSAAVFLWTAVILSKSPVAGFSAQTYAWCIALGLVPQLIGHSTLNWSLKYLSAAFVSVALLGEPIGSSLLALIFLNEAPGFLEVAGSLLILFGIVVTSIQESKKTSALS